jgi:hypothetical protein
MFNNFRTWQWIVIKKIHEIEINVYLWDWSTCLPFNPRPCLNHNWRRAYIKSKLFICSCRSLCLLLFEINITLVVFYVNILFNYGWFQFIIILFRSMVIWDLRIRILFFKNNASIFFPFFRCVIKQDINITFMIECFK